MGTLLFPVFVAFLSPNFWQDVDNLNEWSGEESDANGKMLDVEVEETWFAPKQKPNIKREKC